MSSKYRISLSSLSRRDARSNRKVEVGVSYFNYNRILCEKIAIILLSAYDIAKIELNVMTMQCLTVHQPPYR